MFFVRFNLLQVVTRLTNKICQTSLGFPLTFHNLLSPISFGRITLWSIPLFIWGCMRPFFDLYSFDLLSTSELESLFVVLDIICGKFLHSFVPSYLWVLRVYIPISPWFACLVFFLGRSLYAQVFF